MMKKLKILRQITLMTEALKIGNCTAMMYTKRADLLLKAKRPTAAIADCAKALELNPDSAKAFRIRGKANRKLQNWDDAHTDLETAQKLDYDDDTEDVRKFVMTKWKKREDKRVRQRYFYPNLIQSRWINLPCQVDKSTI